MRKHLITSISILFAFICTAQNPTFEWAAAFGGQGFDNGNSITTDANGNVYSTGTYQDTVDFDPGSSVSTSVGTGSFDAYIQKLDPNGNLLWVKNIGGTGAADIVITSAIAVDTIGNVFVTGYFQGSVDFNPGMGTVVYNTSGNRDAFTLKLDQNGDFQWLKRIVGSNNEFGYSICIDQSGNVITAGTFRGTIDFDPGSGSFMMTVVGTGSYIQKLNTNGDFVWAASMDNSSAEAVTTDQNGNVLTTGSFLGTVDFDPGSSVNNLIANGGATDAFIQKLDANGNYLWAKSLGAANVNDEGSSITVDANNNVLATGYFKGTVDFDPGSATYFLTTPGIISPTNDAFILKLNAQGNFVWAIQIGGDVHDYGIGITTDAASNVYSTGHFVDVVDFDPGVGVFNLTADFYNSDVYVQKLDSNANFIWAGKIGSANVRDLPYSICLDSDNSIYTTGEFGNTIDLDPGTGVSNQSSNGFSDIFILKLSQCSPNTGIDVQSACDSYTWINGNNYTSSNTTATFTLSNSGGCDSVVTLDLSLSYSTTATDVQRACGSYTWIDGNTYIVSNSSSTHTIVNSAGCDSLITLNLTIDTVNNQITQSGFELSAVSSGATYQWLNCDSNYQAIVGETAQIFTASANGSYAYEASLNSCVDTSDCILITGVGLANNSLLTHIQIYPNPTQGRVAILLEQMNLNPSIRLLSPLGQELKPEISIQENRMELEIEGSPGIYLLELRDEENAPVVFRVFKQ